VKSVASTVSIVTGGAAAAAGAVAIAIPVTAPVAVPVAGVLGGTSVVAGAVTTVIECGDGGPVRACVEDVATTALAVGTFGTGNAIAHADEYGALVWNSLTGAVEFVGSALQHARNEAAAC
jgi:hypothetical protein